MRTKLTKRERVLVYIMIVVLVIFAGWLLIQPAMETAMELKDQASQVELERSSHEQAIAMRPIYSDTIAQAEERILRGVITQQLLPLSDGSGRVVATEVLVGTDAVANLIRENKCFQLPTVMQSGMALGMHTMNAELTRLMRSGRITQDIAHQHSNDKAEFRQYIE